MSKNKNIKGFELPHADVIVFEGEDIITTSVDPNELPSMPYVIGEET